ncbi:MAG TPA: hypothetical protein VK669_07480 [Candidatus Limnocylindrales bacterium]|nr:hypothetical protein [Candidatus Limnocylindrales bacterium]
MSYLPIALAVAGTVLMAVVIFAPVPVPATVTVSFAPPAAPPCDLPFTEMWSNPAPFEPAAPRWPALLDPSAADCDAATRLALVDALRAVRAPWADEILRRALDDEHDGTIREAIGSL